ncbi:alpha-glucan family phosphorylase [Streptomyces sp. SL13]|uniref:glycogen phosphorylase n=1 Tax=Streptantibioticus silvisoli TaxID=2705255 RepID=A0AA90K6Y8_9ACTN|nr:alpha-glucan family phosphorylase [Streptantibioticus silvisoli]MDI5968338.1 alpha-glucan family phosphorylase [Streptantibioticus silvisoli]
MKAIRRFTVRTVLPEPLRPLRELARNLRWSWHPPTRELLRSVDPDGWAAAGGDPLRLLASVPADRLAELARDRAFRRRLAAAADDLGDYLARPRWYQRQDPVRLPAAIAYFSPEYGITATLPQYSGGLGILAGDHLKAASDLGVPLIGVGLLYRHGYFRQSLDRDGWQREQYPVLDPNALPLEPLPRPDGTAVGVTLTLPGGRPLHARVWKAQVGRVPLLLLDSDVEGNTAEGREVTDRLYGGGSEHRLLQEMLLGIGGVRAVRAYCALSGHPAPEVFHTNEGHAGFLGLERVSELSGRLDFDAAVETVRSGTVFTTHTPVPAGIDRFERGLIARHFGDDGELPGVPADRVLDLGAETYPGGDPGVFNMAVMGLRLAQRANGVSTLHGAVSREMFAGLWPGLDPDEVPIGSITNGVHAPTWIADATLAAIGPRLGGEEALALGDERTWAALRDLPDAAVWELRRVLRSRLVDDARVRLRESWLRRGADRLELGWTDDVLDPDVLTIGFARRVPSYKRLTLMLRDRDRLTALLLHPERPVQFVVAGKAHPADEGGKRLVRELVRFADDPAVRHRVVFLPDYDMGMAETLVPGCDVWLNNPLRPLEACGTSGMKAALNGGLNLSVLDGWWDEWYDGRNGWPIPTADGAGEDPERRDDIEAAALYDLIEQRVAPRFYDTGRDGVPAEWTGMVRHTLATLGPKVLAGRMVRDYVEQLYGPAARAHRAATDQAVRDLAAWKDRVRRAWPSVRVDQLDAAPPDSGPEVGADLPLRARVALGGLQPSDVDVQLVYGPVDDADRITAATVRPLKPAAAPAPDGTAPYEGTLPLTHGGPFGYTVRVLPTHPLLASPAELGLVALPLETEGMTAGVLR